jgi:hypothetical protein
MITTATPATELFVRPDLFAPPILRFVADSALAGCTTVETHPNGWARIAPRWPVAGFSSGEQVLWRLLGSLIEGDLHAAFDRLSTVNLRALCEVVDFMKEQVA